MPPTTRLFLVRHGAAEGTDGLVVGQVDLPISVRGAASVTRLAESWREVTPTRLISSDLERALATARILNRKWRLPIETDARLREMDFGDWDGRLWDTLQEEDRIRLDAWMADWQRRSAPGGEAFTDVENRAAAWLDELWPAITGETVIAVAHGGTIRAILCRVLGLDLGRAFHLYLDHGRVSAIFSGRRGREVRFVNADLFPV